MKKLFLNSVLCAALITGGVSTAQAHPNASDASALSMLPIAVSVAAPVMFISGGAMLTVVAIEASAEGTVWVLERASDGVRASIAVAGGVSRENKARVMRRKTDSAGRAMIQATEPASAGPGACTCSTARRQESKIV
jgi:hypothetical protein